MKRLLLLISIGLLGCGNNAPRVKCTDDTQCILPGSPGICVPDENVCAVVDATCPSGYRYDVTSGRGDCVASTADMSVAPEDIRDMTTVVFPPPQTDLAFAPQDAYTPPGSSWSVQAISASDLCAVFGTSATDVYVAGAACTLLHSSDRGKTWQSVTLNNCTSSTTKICGLWGASSSLLSAGAVITTSPLDLPGGAIYSTTDGWVSHSTGTPQQHQR